VDRVDDLSVVDAAQVRGGNPEIGMSPTVAGSQAAALIIPLAVALGLLGLSQFLLRRVLAFLAMVAELLVIGQILRFRLGVGLGAHWQKPHAVGIGY
jgi:hypothetical protein